MPKLNKLIISHISYKPAKITLLTFVCVCVCVHPFTLKALSVWNSCNVRQMINDVVLKTRFSLTSRYFRMKRRAFLTRQFILFAQQKRAKPRLNQCTSCSQIVRPFFIIIRHHLAPHYIVTRPTSDTPERGRNLTRKGYSNYKPRF